MIRDGSDDKSYESSDNNIVMVGITYINLHAHPPVFVLANSQILGGMWP